MAPPPLIFLAGIPASGKSHFGEWLEHEHGYLHVDAERLSAERDSLDSKGLRSLWDSAFARRDFADFSTALRTERVLVNWGFPIDYLGHAIALRAVGFAPFWFDADLKAARLEFVDTGKPGADFDHQVRGIASARGEISGKLAPTVIEVLFADRSRLAPEEIYATICGTGP